LFPSVSKCAANTKHSTRYKHEIEAWARGRTRFGSQDLLAVLRREAARQESEESAREAARQPVKALLSAVKEQIVEQITAE
jgi:hypothetical protein